MSPYSIDGGDNALADQDVYQLIIRIEPEDGNRGVLKYAVYGVNDIRYYGGGEITDYNYFAGGQVIPVMDFR